MATTTVRDTQRERESRGYRLGSYNDGQRHSKRERESRGYRLGGNNNSQRHPKREREQRLPTRWQQRQSETPKERERERERESRGYRLGSNNDSQRHPKRESKDCRLVSYRDSVSTQLRFTDKSKSCQSINQVCPPEFQPNTTDIVCTNCFSQISKQKWPAVAITNDLAPDSVPIELARLSSDEVRLITSSSRQAG